MFHVLHSFSLFCTTCGYCQGMGPLAATLLCYFEPEVCLNHPFSSYPILSCLLVRDHWIELLNQRCRKSTRALYGYMTHSECTKSSGPAFPGC